MIGIVIGHDHRSDPGGGGKDPDFWCAFEDGEVKVIGAHDQS
jgi:hypothetical protein